MREKVEQKKQKSMNLDSDLSHILFYAIGGIAAMPGSLILFF